ncbi:jg3494 [Pararge aegeria aegeria]|uniref:Jg3494 protein n=1 Tax=Pararge aegeria aegeria TaxID=348720 RepID=A0A8S4SJY6_9NEOP|nr:jg3494 [Pararge aegeria aegeria]
MLMDATKPPNPTRMRMVRLGSAPHDSFVVFCPPGWGSTKALLNGCHFNTLEPQRPSVLRAMCPAHCQFSFAHW